MIKIDNLVKSFGAKRAVDGVSFAVERGEVLGFLGPNGAGKSTTMRVITGFMPPSAGRVSVGGFDVVDSPLAAKRLIGYLPQAIGEPPPAAPPATAPADASDPADAVPADPRRVYDIRDPRQPKEIAYFVPGDPQVRIGTKPSQLVAQSEDVLVDRRGCIYLSDKNHGIHILQLKQSWPYEST